MSWVSNALSMAHGTLVYFAPLTPIKSDDALVVLLEAIQEDAALFGYTSSAIDIVDALPLPRSADGAEMPVHTRTVDVSVLPRPVFKAETIDLLHSKGFDVDDFMKYLPAIIQVIQLFRKKRKD